MLNKGLVTRVTVTNYAYRAIMWLDSHTYYGCTPSDFLEYINYMVKDGSKTSQMFNAMLTFGAIEFTDGGNIKTRPFIMNDIRMKN